MKVGLPEAPEPQVINSHFEFARVGRKFAPLFYPYFLCSWSLWHFTGVRNSNASETFPFLKQIAFTRLA